MYKKCTSIGNDQLYIHFMTVLYTRWRFFLIAQKNHEKIRHSYDLTGDINDRAWCSTSTDQDHTHQAGSNTWGYCDPQLC